MIETHEVARRIRALEEVHALLERCYRHHGVDERTAFCVDLAAEEIFTNMVRHNDSDSESLSLTIEVTDAAIRLEWIDRGVAPFDPDSLPPVDTSLPMDERHPGGLGLHLVKSVVDRVTYEYENGDMRVTVVKALEG